MRPHPRRVRAILFATVLVALLATCSGAATPQPSIPPDAVHLTAKDLKFNTAELHVPAGKPFTIVLDNLESAPHNVAIYQDSSYSTPIHKGDAHGGPGTFVSVFPALPAGIYAFRCEIHRTMTGTVVAG